MLRDAASMVLEDSCVEIALALAKSAIEGHVLSARLLLHLAEGLRLGKVQMTQKPQSVAIVLEAEPQWIAEAAEESAKAAIGSGESED